VHWGAALLSCIACFGGGPPACHEGLCSAASARSGVPKKRIKLVREPVI
jgi:hypothetical protein